MGLIAPGLLLIYPCGCPQEQGNVILFEGQRIKRIVWWHKRNQCWSQEISAVPCSMERSLDPVSLCFCLSFVSSAFSTFTDRCSSVTFYYLLLFSFEMEEYFRRLQLVSFINIKAVYNITPSGFLGSGGSELVDIIFGLSYCQGLVLQCSGPSR